MPNRRVNTEQSMRDEGLRSAVSLLNKIDCDIGLRPLLCMNTEQNER